MEPEPRPRPTLRACSIEEIEDVLLIFRGYPWTVIGDRENRALPANRDVGALLFGAILCGVF